MMTVKMRGFVISAAVVLAQAGTPYPLTLLTDPKAKCMDGSQGGYYWQPASAAANSSKWVFVLDGGGECTTQAECYSHLNTSLGSSKFFAPNRSSTGDFYDSDGPKTNPDFASWNHVMVPYCR